jgi:pSer/pThr/pTyr-binding forkhead associated (FHA) protein
MKLSLVVLSEGKATGQAIAIKLPQFLIGRDPQCHLRPASPVVSKRHCALLMKNGKAYVRDFDSTNGTFVNDDRVTGQREIKNGDMLKLGPMTFEVQLEGVPAVDKPTPLPANRSADGEEDAAAMLLLPDEDVESSAENATVDSSVPDGSTIMEIPVMGMEGEKAAQDAKEKEKDKKKAAENANTASAAAAILAKYSRRQRS